MEDNLVRKSDGGFSISDYLENPENYASIFSVKVRSSMFVVEAPFTCAFLCSVYFSAIFLTFSAGDVLLDSYTL